MGSQPCRELSDGAKVAASAAALRKVEYEPRATISRVQPRLTAMQHHHPVYDRKTEPRSRALRVCLAEPLEETILNGLRHTWPVIIDGELTLHLD